MDSVRGPRFGVRPRLASLALRATPLAAAATVGGALLGAAATLAVVWLPGFLIWWASPYTSPLADFLRSWGTVYADVLTTLGLWGVCALLASERSRLLALSAGVLVGLLSVGALVQLIGLLGEAAPTPAATAAFWSVLWGKPLALCIFGEALLWTGRWRLATLLFALGASEVPMLGQPLYSLARLLGEAEWPVLLLGVPGSLGPGLAGAVGWSLLGVAIFLAGRELERRGAEDQQRARAEENRKKIRRLYEEALGTGDLSMVDELVAGDFFDHLSRQRGPEALKRSIANLRHSFPDLKLSVEEQRAEGDLITTRCLLSGTDRGGVLWYPPTNEPATFAATYEDRFSDGKLVEHRGQTDTRGLLEQLGLPMNDV